MREEKLTFRRLSSPAADPAFDPDLQPLALEEMTQPVPDEQRHRARHRGHDAVPDRGGQLVAGAVRSERWVGPAAAGQEDGAGADLPPVRGPDGQPSRPVPEGPGFETGLDRDARSPGFELEDLENGRGLVRHRIDAAGFVRQEAKPEALEKSPDLRGAEPVQNEETSPGSVEVKAEAERLSFRRLHRPPPVARSFLPIRGRRSRRTTDAPRRAAVIAATRPAAPAPMTARSTLSRMLPV